MNTLGQLPSFRTVAAKVSGQISAMHADPSNVGDRAEINKGWFNHHLNPDGQAGMLATEAPVASLRAARLALGWTQLRVARRAGVSVSAVSIAERLTVGVSADLRAKITRALAVSQ